MQDKKERSFLQLSRTARREVEKFRCWGNVEMVGIARVENEDVSQEFVVMERPVRRSQLVLQVLGQFEDDCAGV